MMFKYAALALVAITGTQETQAIQLSTEQRIQLR